MRDELRAVAEGLAARVGRSVAIDDPRMRLLAYTAHQGEVDEYRVASVLHLDAPADATEHALSWGIATASEPVRVPRLVEQGLMERVVVPIRCADQLLGYLWLIDDDESLTEQQLRYAAEAAAAAGQLLHREQLLGDLQHSRDRELVRDLLSEDDSVREHAVAAISTQDLLPGTGNAVVVAVCLSAEAVDRGEVADTELDAALSRAVRHLTPVPATSVTRPGGRGALVVAATRLPSLDRLRDQAEQVIATVDKALGDDGTRAAVGPIVSSLAEAHTSHECADDAIRVAAAVPGFGPVVSYDELGIYRLLVQLPHDQLAEEAMPAGLRRLINRGGPGQLVQTLETYLDCAGDVRSSVERLHVHRATLYYRLSRIEELTGMQLSDGGHRLSLHLGLKVARLQGIFPLQP